MYLIACKTLDTAQLPTFDLKLSQRENVFTQSTKKSVTQKYYAKVHKYARFDFS